MSQLDLSYTRKDLRVTRGSTLPLRWTLAESDGSAIDLTGATVTMVVRETPAESSATIATKNGAHESPLSEGKTILDWSDEEMTIGVDGEVTNYWYELWLIEADGDDWLPFAGIFQVAPAGGPA
jgi:hypothetical protein